jgi:hypothetical protein
MASETFLDLLFPFEYQFLHVSVLPRSMLSALQCPTPFLIGIHSSMKEEALKMEHIHQDLYVIDLDFDSITPAYVVECPFPSIIRNRLLRFFRNACFGTAVDLDYSHLEADLSNSDPILELRTAILETWTFDLLKDLENHVVVLPDSPYGNSPLYVLDTPSFLHSKPSSYSSFLSCFTKCTTFSSYLTRLVAQRNIQRPSLLGCH